MIYWFTGQPGAGKTEIAKKLVEYLNLRPCVHIDGDDLREIFDNKDYSENGRKLNIQRAQDIALFLNNKKYDVVVSLVSPYRDQREDLKNKSSVIEIYVHTTEERGREKFHVSNYEPPLNNFVTIDTTGKEVYESYNELLKKIFL